MLEERCFNDILLCWFDLTLVHFLVFWHFLYRGGVPLYDPRVHPPISGRGERRRRALREAHETEVQGARPQQHIP